MFLADRFLNVGAYIFRYGVILTDLSDFCIIPEKQKIDRVIL